MEEDVRKVTSGREVRAAQFSSSMFICVMRMAKEGVGTREAGRQPVACLPSADQRTNK